MKAFLLKYRSSLLLFAVMFLFGWGSAAVVAKWQSDRETEETMHIEAAVDNWGLGFGESGKELQPTGNATADELKQYDTYYIGSKEEKVIYLTFDCGYENGNTEKILEALKKHDIYVRFWGSERIEQYLRITVGTKEEMQILFDFLREYINNK